MRSGNLCPAGCPARRSRPGPACLHCPPLPRSHSSFVIPGRVLSLCPGKGGLGVAFTPSTVDASHVCFIPAAPGRDGGSESLRCRARPVPLSAVRPLPGYHAALACRCLTGLCLGKMRQQLVRLLKTNNNSSKNLRKERVHFGEKTIIFFNVLSALTCLGGNVAFECETEVMHYILDCSC